MHFLHLEVRTAKGIHRLAELPRRGPADLHTLTLPWVHFHLVLNMGWIEGLAITKVFRLLATSLIVLNLLKQAHRILMVRMYRKACIG